jgi:anti-anti-sigma factor
MTGKRYFSSRFEPPVLVVEVLKPVGSLADDDVLHELDLLLEAVNQHTPQAVIVDFRQVAYFGSSLLESLRVIWRHIEPLGGRMALCNLSPVGRDIIELAKFHQVWTIADNVEDAKRRLALPPQ